MMKKFIWLKFRDDFFTQPKIKKLRKIAGGDTLTVIYLKMMLLSIKTDGVIEYQGIEKGLADELALILDEEESNVNITLLYMEKMGLIETLCESSYLLPSVPPLIGSESDSAERMRRLRSKNKELPSQSDGQVISGDEDVTLEKEEDRELDIGGDKHEYLEFRLAGDNITNPKGLEKTILRDLTNPKSTESKYFYEWKRIKLDASSQLIRLIDEFSNFGYQDRKRCKDITKMFEEEISAKIDLKIFEIAFFEASKVILQRQQRTA